MSKQAGAPYLPGLAISVVIPQAQNFKPPSWPPEDNWPISVDANGRAISRFSDHTWDLSPWHGSSLSLTFNDGPKLRSTQVRIDADNAQLLRIIAANFLYGIDAVAKPRTLKASVNALKPLFALCTDHGITAADLYRHPRVVDEFVASQRAKKGSERILTELHRLWYQRNAIGFVVLNEDALRKLASAVSRRESTQYAYIPPRIWTYQNLRLRECLDDFIHHQSQIEACFDFCMKAYFQNASSTAMVFKGLPGQWTPFMHKNRHRMISGKAFYGRFRLTAERFNIANLLDKWVDFGDKKGIQAFSTYLSLISFVGAAYIVNFSLMRREEGGDLRANCLTIERDVMGQDVHLISAGTTKTQEDEDARWIVSESAIRAIKAMRGVTSLRISAAQRNRSIAMTDEELSNPLLQTRAYEPWAGLRHYKGVEKKQAQSFSLLLDAYPKLLDPDVLRITEADLTIAREINDQLPAHAFAAGQIWPLGWHQLRRTGAVNMMSSGLVTESDLCYQLKHLNRLMSRYYANNHRHLKAALNKQAAGAYVAEIYEALARKAATILSPDHLSPHGEKRKLQLLELIELKTHVQLVKQAQAGKLNYHETFLGGCSKPGTPCPLGGVSNISSCLGFGSGMACEWVTVDRNKRPVIAQLVGMLTNQVKPENEGSMLNQSLKAQIESATRALEVIDAN